MHYPDLCSSLHWHFCDIYSTQAAEERMELWHKSGDLVCWSVLWLCPSGSSCIVCNPQVLLSTIRPCPAILSLRLLPICLYSCIGNVPFFLLTMTYCYSFSLYMFGKTLILEWSADLKSSCNFVVNEKILRTPT